MTIEKALAQAAESLRVLERGFALVGGLAVSLRAEVRFTRDAVWRLSTARSLP